MRIILEEGDPCPICGSSLEENSYGEDEAVYLECHKDSSHYSKFIGLWDDLDEIDDEDDND